LAIDGNWNLTMQSPMGPRPVTAEFTSSGGTIGGNFTGAQGAAPVTGTIDGNNVNFAATVQGPMGQMELKFSGTLDGDSMSGTVAFGAFGSGTFTGSKA
jgi:hypothetical protein